MKRFILITLLSTIICVSKAQKVTSTQSATAMIKAFYTAYITSVASDDIPAMNEKIKVLKKKYCTKKLIAKLPKLIAQLDADPIIKAQDSDTSILKSLTIKRNIKRPDDYTVSYAFTDRVAKPRTTITTIHLTVINQNGRYQIDDVR